MAAEETLTMFDKFRASADERPEAIILGVLNLIRTVPEYPLKLEGLRTLRNYVGGVGKEKRAEAVVKYFNNGEKLKEFSALFLNDAENIAGLRILFQLVANALNQPISPQDGFEEHFSAFAKEIFENCHDAKSRNILSFCLLNLMKKSENLQSYLQFLPTWLKISEDSEESDFVLLCLKHFLEHEPTADLEQEHKEKAISLILELELAESLSERVVVSLVNEFTFVTDSILTTNLGDLACLRPRLTTSLLSIIVATSTTKHKLKLQDMKSLLINTVYLLRMVHEAGKQGLEDFRPIGKLSELSKLKESEVGLETNPTYGFKVDLIRLLVNLTWEHHENKTLVGELEGVALILDCSQMDGKNPYITQWVVIAVRALCSDHDHNKSILLGLRQQGAADSTLLEELGIKLAPNSALGTQKS